ncbi:MAG: hypothetical protein WD845_15265 [Pirellulales bacterium]
MTIIEEFRQDESRVLDRLVDGELSQADRRTLLASLDDEPGGWRRCALAFLEAQSWRWQLAQVASGPLVAQAAAAVKRPDSALRGGVGSRSFWGACLAIAGSLLVAFGLGTRYTNEAPNVAHVSTAGDSNLGGAGTSTSVAAPTTVEPANSIASAAQPTVDSDPSAANATGEPSAWETLTLSTVDEAGSADPDHQFEVRVRDADADAASLDALLASGESTLPAALVEQLQQDGWEVTSRRQLMPVSLSDGRQMVVPVEQVDFRRPDVAQF